MTKAPTTLTELQALVNRLDAALKERDLPRAKVHVWANAHEEMKLIAYTDNNATMGGERCHATISEEGIAEIEAFIADQICGKEKAEQEAVKAMAAAVEAARAADWPDDWINPMAATLQMASDNLLTYRPEVPA